VIRLPLSEIIELGTVNLVTNSLTLRLSNSALYEEDIVLVTIFDPLCLGLVDC
jgi:hypothetical protein